MIGLMYVGSDLTNRNAPPTGLINPELIGVDKSQAAEWLTVVAESDTRDVIALRDWLIVCEQGWCNQEISVNNG